MANQRLCMGCMNPLTAQQEKCELCGYPVRGNNPPQYLPVGTMLAARYLVGRVLAVGGDAALYIGYDTTGHERVHIHEFFPDTLCRRGEGNRLAVSEGKEDEFEGFLKEYRSFAGKVAKLKALPAIPTVLEVPEENGTVYIVEEITDGVTLETYLAQNGDRLTWDEARPLFMGLISSLSAMHENGVLHLGICPSNIVVGRDGKLHLRGISLPEVRQVGTKLKPHLLNGFSAPEQYMSRVQCTPATDVYGLAATLFRALSGKALPDGVSRAKGKSDIYMSADMAEAIPAHVLETLVAALSVEQTARIGDMETFRDCLASASEAVTALRAEEEHEEAQTAKHLEEDDEVVSRKTVWMIVAGVVLVLLLIGTVVVFSVFGEELFGDGGVFSGGDKPELEKRTNVAGETVITYAVDPLIGQNYYEIRNTNLTGYMKLELLYLEYSDAPRGTILKQEPAAGTMQERESTVKVVISAGSEEITVPNLAGWDEVTARMYLEALGVRVESIRVVESIQERDKVDSTDPSPGMAVLEGDVVILKISDVEPVIDEPEDPFADDEPTDDVLP